MSLLPAGWIYSFEDYLRIYDLTHNDLDKKILDFPSVIGDFNAHAHTLQSQVISAGPLFELSHEELLTHTQQFLQNKISVLKQNPHVLKDKNSLDSVIATWKNTTDALNRDYPKGKQSGRYQAVDLFDLPYQSYEFDLALCTHLFFHDIMSDDKGMPLLKKLCDIAGEVRIYPLHDAAGELTDALNPLMLRLQQQNYGVEVREVAFDMRRGGNAMLRVWAQACEV